MTSQLSTRSACITLTIKIRCIKIACVSACVTMSYDDMTILLKDIQFRGKELTLISKDYVGTTTAYSVVSGCGRPARHIMPLCNITMLASRESRKSTHIGSIL